MSARRLSVAISSMLQLPLFSRVTLAQLTLQDLARARDRQCIDEIDAARTFVAGDQFLGVDPYLLGRRCGSRLQHDHRVNALARSEEHTSELQSLMRISYAVLCLKKKKY